MMTSLAILSLLMAFGGQTTNLWTVDLPTPSAGTVYCTAGSLNRPGRCIDEHGNYADFPVACDAKPKASPTLLDMCTDYYIVTPLRISLHPYPAWRMWPDGTIIDGQYCGDKEGCLAVPLVGEWPKVETLQKITQ